MKPLDRLDSLVATVTEKWLVEVKTWLEPWFMLRGDKGRIDSTENVGEEWGVHSIEPDGDFEAEDYVLAATGAGGSRWQPGLPTRPPSLSEVILDTEDLLGFWKLSESSGTTAFDSLNGWDMEPPATPGNPYTAPTWASVATPYGEQSALFAQARGESNASFPNALTGDLTIGIWARRVGTAAAIIGQGDPIAANGAGVALYFGTAPDSISIFIGDTTGGPHTVEMDSPPPSSNQWYFIVATRTSHIWRLYVNGEAQAATYDDSGTNYTSTSGAWIGNIPGSSTVRYFNGQLSYGFIFDRALSAAEIENFYTVGISGDTVEEGWVATADGSGGVVWAEPTIEVDNGSVERYEKIILGDGLSGTDNGDDTITVDSTEPEAAAHIADTVDAHDASAISITDSGGYYSGDNVESALQQLGTLVPGGGGGGNQTDFFNYMTSR